MNQNKPRRVKYQKIYSYGFFWFEKGYNEDLNMVIYVFGPSQEYLIIVVSHKTRSFLRKTQFSKFHTSISRLPQTAIRRLLRLTVGRILNCEENGDYQLVKNHF